MLQRRPALPFEGGVPVCPGRGGAHALRTLFGRRQVLYRLARERLGDIAIRNAELAVAGVEITMACRMHCNARMPNQDTEQDGETEMAVYFAHDALDNKVCHCSGAASIARSMSEFASSRR